MKLTENILPQVSEYLLPGLRRADGMWQGVKTNQGDIPEVIRENSQSLGNLDIDVVIAGGTLGIILAVCLQKRGWRVVVLERGKLRGREQEWNISRQELEVFLELEILSKEELEQAIVTEYNPARVSFHQGYELWVKDVLNIGVDPVFLLETCKQKFITAGGQLEENCPFKSATVHPDGVMVEAGSSRWRTRLLIDVMGHFSPISSQARQGVKPDGVCLVVGSCAQGYQENSTGDLIASFTPITHQCQYFWEAFPARDGRTTYLFTYVDAHPERFSLEFFMEEYLRLLPEYQQIDREKLQFKRFLFGFFPSYEQSPLRLPWDHILSVGDSSGSQSPVSFGGFGALIRHLARLTKGIDEALKVDLLTQQALVCLQPYQPNIAVNWLFQKAMRVGIKAQVNPNQINNLMSGVFRVMDKQGDQVLKPFLQDVIQFSALTRTLPLVNPKLVLPILPQLGLPSLLNWSRHYLNLGFYSGLYPVCKSLQSLSQNLSPQQQYYYHRYFDSYRYGAGLDYHA